MLNETIIRERKQKQRRGALLCWVLCLASLALTLALLFLPAVPDLLPYFVPLAFFHEFLLSWLDPTLLMLLLALIPVLGCALLSAGRRWGKPLVTVPQYVLLAANCIVTPLHLLNGASLWWFDYMKQTAWLALAGLIVPVLILIGVRIWAPKPQT